MVIFGYNTIHIANGWVHIISYNMWEVVLGGWLVGLVGFRRFILYNTILSRVAWEALGQLYPIMGMSKIALYTTIMKYNKAEYMRIFLVMYCTSN